MFKNVFIGENAKNQSKRILILGESHYEEAGERNYTVTAFVLQIPDHFQYLSDTPAAVDFSVIGRPVSCQNPPSSRSAVTVR